MTINFECGNCGKQLATPDDKAGKTGKCPDCGEPVSVPLLQSGYQAEDPFDFGNEASSLPPIATGRTTRSCPMCGATVSSSDRACSSCGEELDSSSSAAATSGFSTGHIIDAGQVLSTAWARYQEQMGTAIGGLLLMGLANFGGSFIIGFALGMLIGGKESEILAQVAGGIYGTWLEIGFCRFTLAIARGERAEIPLIFSGGPFFLRGLMANIVFYLGIGVVAGISAALMAGLAAAISPLTLIIVLPIALLVIIRVALMYFWRQFVLVDTDAPGISCLQKSSELMPGNFGAVILLVLAGVALILMGLIMLIVGVIFTAPLVAVMWATAYDQLSGGGARRSRTNY